MARQWFGGDVSTKLADTTVTWANNDPQSTEKLVDLGSPDTPPRSSNPALLVIVRNPSAVTTLAGEVRVKYSDGGTTRYAKFATFVANTSDADGEAFLIDGGLIANGGQLSLKNSTALGAADTFAARVVVYEI